MPTNHQTFQRGFRYALRSVLLAILALAIFPAAARAGIELTSYSFAADQLPQIQADAAEISLAQSYAGSGGFYKLRARIYNIPFLSGDYHMINSINNNGFYLTGVPGTGTFDLEVYWVAYNSSGILQMVGTKYLRSVTILPPAAGGMGLRGEYYNSQNLTSLATTVPSGEGMENAWGTGGPPWTVSADNFSVRWSGFIAPLYSETYTFTTGSDDGMRVYIRDLSVPLIDSWTNGYHEKSGSITLEAGRLYPIVVEFYEGTGNAVSLLWWRSFFQQSQIVLPTRLVPPNSGNIPVAPTIVTPPQSQTVNEGGASLFTTVFNGSPLPAFQWKKNGAPISGATAFYYQIPVTQVADGGIYTVTATNTAGSTTSAGATLTVNPGAAPGTGNGLAGLYYSGTNFGSFVTALTQTTVDFDWGSGVPVQGVSEDNFSVRWTGIVQAPFAGSYQFRVESSDGVRLKIDGVTVIDGWASGSATRTSSPVSFTVGQKKQISLEYFSGTGNASVKLYWSLPGESTFSIVPQSRLYSPTNGLPGWQIIQSDPYGHFHFTEEVDEDNNGTGVWTTDPKTYSLGTLGSGFIYAYTSGFADTGAVLEFNSSSDPNNPSWTPLVYSASGGYGGNFSFGYVAGAGTYRLRVGATYQNNEDDYFILTVFYRPDVPEPVVPEITSANTATFPWNASGSFLAYGSFTFTANGSPAADFSITGTLPQGLSFDAGSKTISGFATHSGTFPGKYPLVVHAANIGGNAFPSQNFLLEVSDSSQVAPSITTQPPAEVSVSAGATATIAAGVAGTPTPAIKWERQTGPNQWIQVAADPPYSGVTTATLTITGATVAMDNYKFRLVATNPKGTATSSQVTLKVSPSTGAGTYVVSTPAGLGGASGYANGFGSSVRFNESSALASNGTYVYIADALNNRIRKMLISTGEVSDFASGFSGPSGVAVDSAGYVYVADTGNNKIKQLHPSGTTVTRIIGTGDSDFLNSNLTGSKFSTPLGIAVTPSGNEIYVADFFNQKVRRINISADTVTTLASGFSPWGMTLDPSGTMLYVTDYWNGKVKKYAITAGDAMTELTPTFSIPRGVAVDANNVVYVAETGYHTIKKVVGSSATTIAGNVGVSGIVDGPGAWARFYHPFGVVAVGSTRIYVGDAKNHTIRLLQPDGAPLITSADNAAFALNAPSTFTVVASGSPAPTFSITSGTLPPGVLLNSTTGQIYGTPTASGTYVFTIKASNGSENSQTFTLTVAASSSTPGFVVSTPAGQGGSYGYVDHVVGTLARFNEPGGVANDGTWVYIVDQLNSLIRRLKISTGEVQTLASGLYWPSGMAIDGNGNLYVADTQNNKVKRVSSAGVFTLTVGDGTPGWVDSNFNQSRFSTPIGVAVNSDGTYVYVADLFNDKVRRIDVNGQVVTTLVGGFRPWGIALNPSGTLLYVSDYLNGQIKRIDLTDNNSVTTLPGSFSNARGLAVNGFGEVFVVDTGTHTIRKISGNGVDIIAGASGLSGTADGAGASARFYYPFGVTANSPSSLFVSDAKNHTIRRLLPYGAPLIVSPNGATFAIGVADSFYVLANGSPLPTFSIAGGSLPSGITLNATTGELSGTTQITGTYPVLIQATNSSGTDTQAFTLVVRNPGVDTDGDGVPDAIETLLQTNTQAAGSIDASNGTLQLKIIKP